MIFKNPFIFGITLIIVGIPPAFFGTMWFKYICFIFGGFSTFVVSAFTLQGFGLMEDGSLGFWPCVGISVVLAVIISVILYNYVLIGSNLIGFTFGAIVGLMIWSIINSWMTWKHVIPAIAFAGVGAALGVVFSCKWKDKTIMYGTSLMGSYTFMRGWSLIFKGYAGEQIMFKLFGVGEPVKLESQMVFYVALLYITFTASSLV